MTRAGADMTQPYYSDERATVIHADCLDALAAMPADSVDAIVTDPPYGLGFMGKAWDDLPPGEEWARECLRVLKPGGHLLAFGGTRTWHRLACAVEDAGFEMRDSIAWLYGSGFPKSLDVSKAIDRQRHDRDDVRLVTAWIASTRTAAGIANRDIDAAFGFNGMAGHWTTQGAQAAIPTLDQIPTLLDVLGVAPDDVPDDIRALLIDLNGMKGQPGPAWFAREVVQERTMMQGGGTSLQLRMGELREVRADITAPATDAARTWQGWGTALKPAFEPIVVARKPLAGTVAANVLTWGTGAINIDACRVGHADAADLAASIAKNPGRDDTVTSGFYGAGRPQQSVNTAGRWPANVVLDPTAAAEQGGASRFFYTAKATSAERPRVAGVAHPTVKPLDLMRWLVRLVTPPGGLVLDPFAGSGTTLEAAIVEGFRCVGIEREADYLPLILHRIERAQVPLGLDGGAA